MEIDFDKLKSVIKEIEEEKQSGDGWAAWSSLCLWLAQYEAAQHSAHPTLGILARFQAFFYASAFSQSDGVPPPAPARVTQTVRLLFERIGYEPTRR